MIKINLLPFRAERKKENIRRELSVYGLSMVFLFTLLIYFSIALNNRLSNLQTERANKTKELRRYSDVLKKIKSIKQKERELKSKINTIRKIASTKHGPVELFDKIAMAIPKDQLWMSSLNQKHNLVTVKGYAVNNDAIALYMTNLEKIKLISSVDLISSSLKPMKEHKMNVCSFTLNIKTISPKKTAKKKGHNRRKR